jgi:hypothetical protein
MADNTPYPENLSIGSSASNSVLQIPSNAGTINIRLQNQTLASASSQSALAGRVDAANDARIPQSNNPPAATITQGHIPYFTRMLSRWAFNVPMKYSWVVVISAHSKDNILRRISAISNLEHDGWDVKKSAQTTLQSDAQDIIGCIFAQSVSKPGENIMIEHAGVTTGSNRGFINAPIINGRANFNELGISFLETNRSFVDGVLRPWSIVVAHDGLIARSRDTSIKADIQVIELARTGTAQNVVRKITTYYDCVPMGINSDDLDYSTSSDYPKMQVRFAFNRYSIKDGG